MNKKRINKIILSIINSNIDSDGTIKIRSGNNGPYNNQDTLARNYAHWIGILKYQYSVSKEKKYLKTIRVLADKICDSCTKYGNIKCFKDNELIETNGLIGQAWVIEGLINACIVLNDMKYYDYAVRIFLSQKYDNNYHLWRVVNCSGKILDFDYVFNHQLWFAASGLLINSIKQNKEIEMHVVNFIDNIEKLYNCYNDGLLNHIAIVGFDIKSLLKRIIKTTIKNIKYFGKNKENKEIEKGYHLFDVYGFALIKQYSNGLLDCSTNKFKKVIDYSLNIENNDIELKNYYGPNINNKYAYPYNSPAFEYPYIDYIFNNSANSDYYDKMIDYQIDNYYDEKKSSFSKNTNDSATLDARIYELCRYLELSDKDEK